MKPTRLAATSPPPAKVSRRRPPWWVVIVSVVFVATAGVRLVATEDGRTREDARECATELEQILGISARESVVDEATATLTDGAELPVWRVMLGDEDLIVIVDIAIDDGTVITAEARVGTLSSSQRQDLLDHRCS